MSTMGVVVHGEEDEESDEDDTLNKTANSATSLHYQHHAGIVTAGEEDEDEDEDEEENKKGISTELILSPKQSSQPDVDAEHELSLNRIIAEAEAEAASADPAPAQLNENTSPSHAEFTKSQVIQSAIQAQLRRINIQYEKSLKSKQKREFTLVQRNIKYADASTTSCLESLKETLTNVRCATEDIHTLSEFLSYGAKPEM